MTYYLPEFELGEVLQGSPESELQTKLCLDGQFMVRKTKQIIAILLELPVRIMNDCIVWMFWG